MFFHICSVQIPLFQGTYLLAFDLFAYTSILFFSDHGFLSEAQNGQNIHSADIQHVPNVSAEAASHTETTKQCLPKRKSKKSKFSGCKQS